MLRDSIVLDLVPLIRERSHIMSAAEGGEGGVENLTYADMKFRGGGEGGKATCYVVEILYS